MGLWGPEWHYYISNRPWFSSGSRREHGQVRLVSLPIFLPFQTGWNAETQSLDFGLLHGPNAVCVKHTSIVLLRAILANCLNINFCFSLPLSLTATSVALGPTVRQRAPEKLFSENSQQVRTAVKLETRVIYDQNSHSFSVVPFASAAVSST